VHILDKIVRDKKQEVEAKKRIVPQDFLISAPQMKRDCHSLSKSLSSRSGIIADFKRRSPSRQVINQHSQVTEVVSAYEKAGASGISVLTDTKYFGGALDDLIQARASLNIPLLRKEFMIDPYQVYEAKAFGADAILLIAAVLDAKEIKGLSKLASDLGMEVLLEIHSEEELEKSPLDHVHMIGVNNRNLKTFEVSLEMSKNLAGLIPEKILRISESGISAPELIRELKPFGYEGFLIGENFMRTDDPGLEASNFIKQI
jgi:indole-3-glycerol phosphate synthase